jgi:hypothetical protein
MIMVKALGSTKQTPRKFKIELTEGEVDFLLTVLSRVGGDPAKSPRKYGERLTRVLTKAAGYDFTVTDARELADEGRINFSKYGTVSPPLGDSHGNTGRGAPFPRGAEPDPSELTYSDLPPHVRGLLDAIVRHI